VIWSPPSQRNDDVTGYQVIYSIYENSTNRISTLLSEEVRHFVIINLGKHFFVNPHFTPIMFFTAVPGVPYQVVVVAFSNAGRGAVNNFTVFFSQELTPIKTPENVDFIRLSVTSVNITWTPLTLFEARGFPEYNVTLKPFSTSSRNRRDFILIPPVITNNSFAIFVNLDSNNVYVVIIGVRTGASNQFNFADPNTGATVYIILHMTQ